MKELKKIETIHIIFREDELQNAKNIIEEYIGIRLHDIPNKTEKWSFKETMKVDEKLFEEGIVSVNLS